MKVSYSIIGPVFMLLHLSLCDRVSLSRKAGKSIIWCHVERRMYVQLVSLKHGVWPAKMIIC